jgi:CubicO group peptidase (beta-lactamase class C family)
VTWGYIVGEIVRRATGKPISQLLREEVAGPLGVAGALFFRVPQDVQGRLARLEEAEGDEGDEEMGAAMPSDSPLLKLGPQECTTAAFGNRADVLSADIPAGGTVTASAVARMYAALLGPVDGVRLISPERLREVSVVAMSGVDQVFGFPTSWGLGYSVGEATSVAQETQTEFGVGGVGGSNAYADIATGVAFALTKNRLAPSFDTAERVGGIVKQAVRSA